LTAVDQASGGNAPVRFGSDPSTTAQVVEHNGEEGGDEQSDDNALDLTEGQEPDNGEQHGSDDCPENDGPGLELPPLVLGTGFLRAVRQN
jgi:hypothetical protein